MGLGEPVLEVQLEQMLLIGGQFGLLPGHVEHVSSSPALRVDQPHFDIASKFGKRRADVVEEAWAVQGHNLDHRAVG